MSNTPTSTTATDLKVGVIGFGWAGQQHLKAYSAMPGVEVIGIAGQETEVGATLATEFDVPLVVSEWQELLELPGLDAVSVAVPTFLHAPIAIAALERGIHVLSEKPIARDAVEGQQMVDAARAAGRVLDVAFNHRRRGDIMALRSIIESGDLGETYHARASWMRRRGIPNPGSWFSKKELSGGGPLSDLGVHVIDWALHLLGEPTVLSVSAVTHSQLGPRGLGGQVRVEGAVFDVEDFVSAFVRLEGGRSLVFETSWAAHRSSQDLMDFSVLGSEGGAELVISGATENPTGDITVFRDADDEPDDYSPVVEVGGNHREVVEEFVTAVRTPDTWSQHDGSVALTRARVIDAAYRSAAEGREVEL